MNCVRLTARYQKHRQSPETEGKYLIVSTMSEDKYNHLEKEGTIHGN